MSVSVELSGAGADCLEQLRSYWMYSDDVTDAVIVEMALLCYFRRLVLDDGMISYDAMVDAWRKYHHV